MADSSLKEQSEQPQARKPCPEETSNFFSRIFLLWIFPLVLQGFRNPLEDKHLWELTSKERGEAAVAQLRTSISTYPTNHHQVLPLTRILLTNFRKELIITAILKFITTAIQLINPILLNRLISFIRDRKSPSPPPISVGLAWAFALLALPFLFAIIENQYYLGVFRIGMRVRSSLQGIIYDKSLTMSPSARAASSLGQVVNLMQMDTQRIGDFCNLLHMLWAAPIQLIVTCILLFISISWSAFIGVLATVLTIPIQGKIMAILVRLRKKFMLITDTRIKLMNEFLQGIKAIKLYAWEIPFSKKIEQKRTEEVDNIKKTIWASSSFFSIMISIPVIIAVITFSFYVGVFKNVLEPATVFTALAYLNLLRTPVMMLPQVATGLIDSRLGISRIVKFLSIEDTEDYSRQDDMGSGSHSESGAPHIIIENGCFRWGGEAEQTSTMEPVPKKKWYQKLFTKAPAAVEPEEQESHESEVKSEPLPNVLDDINLTLKPGKLTAIVGRVGSGKSSLVSAILGEMQKTGGQVSLHGSVAYVAQTAWIFNGTLRSNILFGKDYDEKLYKKAIKVSALKHDLDVLPAGDMTAIGEKGINLSGGQKQRVSIARAVYADRDVYLFDDPLSALDAHVSQTVFDKCISNGGALGDKLRLLITNQVHVLRACDSIVFLEDGRIRAQGTYTDLVEKDQAFHDIVNDTSTDGDDEDVEEKVALKSETTAAEKSIERIASISQSYSKDTRKQGAKLVEEEDRNVGNIKLGSYYRYAVACGNAFLFGLVMAFWVFVGAQGIFTTYWLALWTDAQVEAAASGVPAARSNAFYIGIYFALGVAYALFLVFRSVAFQNLALRAARMLHSQALSSLIRAPMAFFDTTPIGRILSRFTRDIASVDTLLPQAFSQCLTTVLGLIGSYILIAIMLPPFLGAAIPVTIGYFLLQRFFNRTSLELKRLDSISKSPIYAHFSETLSGLSTLRAYKRQEAAMKENREMIDINTRAYFAFISASRWFSLYLELLGSTLIFFTALFSVLLPGGRSASDLGLSLTYVLEITAILGFTIRSITEVEGQMSSVERLEHYGKKLPQERAAIVDNYDHLPDDERPSKEWPKEGAIDIDNVSLRYRAGLELVLKGVSVQIEAGQMVGVIGRTGSGKSTLMVAILRLVELAAGSIKVDNVNLQEIGLDRVRSCITIIPQDPVLFSGTIRFNLDPFDYHTDLELWDALEKSNMKEFVEEFDGGLDSFVSEYGENLSAGQRQLICLTRALLRNSKILILDEASSSLDAQTDRSIQESIRKHMSHATILTIAHRLTTLADYDRIIVMENGIVAEFGAPKDLIEDSRSKLSGFVVSLGHEGATHFRELVRKRIE